jgi:outer membrane protein OmpA-like peptidoglycan-associated protein
MKKLYFLLILSLSTFNIYSQKATEFDKNYVQANKEFELGNYYAVLPLYLNLCALDSTNANLNYLIGYSYLKARSGRFKSIPYLLKAAGSVNPNYKKNNIHEKNAPFLTYKLLGDAYHSHSDFDLAILSYQTYLKKIKIVNQSDHEHVSDAKRKIVMCYTAKEFIANPVRIKIENMGAAINSPYGDYSPVLSADQSNLIFTTRRKQSKGGKTYEGGRYFEDIYISEYKNSEWSAAKSIGESINTNGNEASVGISPDGQEILIYKDDNGDGNIYSTTLKGDVWSSPVKLNNNINSIYWEPSAFISADEQSIYFTSDRPGGYGGRDLYISHKIENGDWGKAANMGSLINSNFDEDAPYIHPDGITLFYSSNGHKTMGGFDIFYSTLSEETNKWSAPINVGYPVNSPDDDIFYVVSPDKTKAYYSSFKENGFGEKDNYMITFLDQEKAPLTILKGNIKDTEGKVPQEVVITVTDNETEKVVVIKRPNSVTGDYLLVLTPGKNYNISYEAEGFLFYSENRQISKKTNYYEVYRPVLLPPIVIGSKVVLNNIFFDFDKAKLRATSNVELKLIYRFMVKYPNVGIEIDGYTDSKGTLAYNLDLSEQRAKAVVDYLLNKGIAINRLQSKGFGESLPAASNENESGKDDPEGRQLNRRVEMKIVEIL